MTSKEKYEELIERKTYVEMTEEEQLFCDEYECDLLIDGIYNLRKQGVEDYKISAYLHDLYADCLINNDVYIANQAEISDDDWSKGLDYYWYEMEEDNPLADYAYINAGAV